MERGQLIIEPTPLSSLLIEMMVPVVISMKSLSLYKRKEMLLAEKEREDKEMRDEIDARLDNVRLPFGSASRSARLLECNSVVQKRMDAIEKYWAYAVGTLRSRGHGISLGRPN